MNHLFLGLISSAPDTFWILLIMLVLGALLTVLPFWFICKKAGFHGALSLLMLVPLGNLILPFVLAFCDWPSLKKNN